MLQVTGLYSGILALIMVVLAFNTASSRGKHKVSLGNGGNKEMEKKVRSFGNFIEYVPMLLILMAVHEFQGMATNLLHGFGITIVVTRLLHALTLLGVLPGFKGRMIGALGTFLMLLVAGGMLVYSSVMAMM